MKRMQSRGRSAIAAVRLVKSERIADYMRPKPLRSITGLAEDLARQVTHHRASAAAADRCYAVGATTAAGLSALRIAVAPTATTAEYRLKLALLELHALPALQAVGNGDVARIVEMLLGDAPTGCLKRHRPDRNLVDPTPTKRHATRRGRDRRSGSDLRCEHDEGATDFGRYQELAALNGRSDQFVMSMIEACNDVKSLEARGPAEAVEGARERVELLSLTLCSLPAVDDGEAQDKVGVLDELLPDLLQIHVSVMRTAIASIAIERGKWPQLSPTIGR